MFRTLTLAAAIFTAAPLAAQQGPCPGQVATIRVNAIKPGKAALAAEAVRDHQAWYAKRKLGTTIERLTVVRSGTGGAATADADRFVTITRQAGGGQRPADDAEWNAFVAKYREATTVISDVRVCMK